MSNKDDQNNQECTPDEFEILTSASSSSSQKTNMQLYDEMKEARGKLDAELRGSQEANFSLSLQGIDTRLSKDESHPSNQKPPEINFCLDGWDSHERQNKDWFNDPYKETSIGTKHLINVCKPVCPSIKSANDDSCDDSYFEDIQKLVIAIKAEDSEIRDGPGLRTILDEIYKNNDKDIDKSMDDAVSQAKSGVLKTKSSKRFIIAERRNQQIELSLNQLCGMMAQEKKSTLFSNQDEPVSAFRATKSCQPMCRPIKSANDKQSDFDDADTEAIQKLLRAVIAEDSGITDDGLALLMILNEIYKNNDKDIDKAMDDTISQVKSGKLKKKSSKRLRKILAERHNLFCGMMEQEKKSTSFWDSDTPLADFRSMKAYQRAHPDHNLFWDQDEPVAAFGSTKSCQPMCYHTNSTDLCETVTADISTTSSQPECSNIATLDTRETPNLFSEQNDHNEYIKRLDDEMKSFFNKDDDTVSESSLNSDQEKDFSVEYTKKADKFRKKFNVHVSFPEIKPSLEIKPSFQKEMMNNNEDEEKENVMQNSTDKMQHSIDIIQEELEKQENLIIQRQVDVMQRQINAMQRELNRIQREDEKEQCPSFLMSPHFPTMPSMSSIKPNRRTGIRELRKNLNSDICSEAMFQQKLSLSEQNFEPYSATNYCEYIPGKDRKYSQGYHEACGYPVQ